MARLLIYSVALFLLSGRLTLFGQVQIDPGTAESLLLERPMPVYPELARRARVQDTVKLLITVSDKGLVSDVGVLSGHPLLNESAVNSVKQSRYEPYSHDGKAVPFFTTVEIPLILEMSEKDYKRDQTLARRYFEEEEKCRYLMNASEWRNAEEICSANLEIVDDLGKHRGATKMRAYRMAGLAALAQSKYEEALNYLNRAHKYGRSSLKEDDAELGDLLVMLGLTYSKMEKPDKARKSYAKGEKILQLAYDHANAILKAQYLPRLKIALEYCMRAAEDAGDSKEAEKLKKRLASLPTLNR
jgi:TonB family protein